MILKFVYIFQNYLKILYKKKYELLLGKVNIKIKNLNIFLNKKLNLDYLFFFLYYFICFFKELDELSFLYEL